MLAENHPAALADLECATALAERIGTRFALAQFKGFVAAARAHRGAAREALPLGREALASANESGIPWEVSVTSRSLAEVLLAQTPPLLGEAEDTIRTAVEIQERHGMNWELALSRLVQGWVLRAKGDRDKSREVLTTALQAFQTMGVAWAVDRARQALAEP